MESWKWISSEEAVLFERTVLERLSFLEKAVLEIVTLLSGELILSTAYKNVFFISGVGY